MNYAQLKNMANTLRVLRKKTVKGEGNFIGLELFERMMEKKLEGCDPLLLNVTYLGGIRNIAMHYNKEVHKDREFWTTYITEDLISVCKAMYIDYPKIEGYYLRSIEEIRSDFGALFRLSKVNI